jgi:outer membrane protein OmpA-like peptidoglycan-associated protein
MTHLAQHLARWMAIALLATLPGAAAAQPSPGTAADDEVATLRVALQPLFDGGQTSLDRREERWVLTVRTETLFESGKDVWTAEGRDLAAEMARALAALPRTTWSVTGHTDSSGSSAFNERLSGLRAEQMRQSMIAEGIKKKRVEAAGIGEAAPVAANTSAEGRAANRRLEISWE